MSYLYPYGDTQQLNLSWFLAKFKELYEYIMNLDPDDIAIATVLSRFTNEYNSSTNYIPGDYVIHEGFIYKANQSTTGNFNPQAWDAALPVNDIQGLRILLGGISRDLTDLEENAITNVQYTPGAATADGLLRQTKNGTAETVMTVDKEPTANSQNPVKSGSVRAELNAISDAVSDEQTARGNADRSLQDQIDDLNDITGDGSLSGFTATDLTGAANELKGSLNTVEGDVEDLENKFPVSIANGGTGASNAKQALRNLGATPQLWQIIAATNVGSTLQTYTAISGRKISDFGLIVCVVIRGGAIRATMFHTVAGFANGVFLELTEVDSTNNQSWYEVKYVDDTHITVQSNRTANVILYGFGNDNSY